MMVVVMLVGGYFLAVMSSFFVVVVVCRQGEMTDVVLHCGWVSWDCGRAQP